MKPHSYLSQNLKWFYLEALYKINPEYNLGLKILLYFWRLMCNLILLSFIICNIIPITNGTGEDLNSMGYNYMSVAIYSGSLIRLNYFYVFYQPLDDLVKKMNTVFKYKAESALEERDMEASIKAGHRLTTWWMVYTVVVAETLTLMPLLFISKTGRILPLDLWYPFDWKISPFFELAYLHQAVAQLIMGTTYGNTDTFFNSSALLAVGQFEILGWEFKNLLFNILLQHGVPKETVLKFREQFGGCSAENYKDELIARKSQMHPELENDFCDVYSLLESKKFDDDMVAGLRNLIVFHQNLLSFCMDLKVFFAPILVSFFLFYMFYVIFMAFVFATTSNSSLFVSIGGYIVAALFEIFLINYSGQLLTEQTKQLSADLYDSPWYICSKKFKSIFRFAYLQIGKPFQFSIGKIGAVSLNTYLWTLKTSFSYFTVLQQVTQKNK